MLIGVTGKIGSGKSMTAEYLVRNHNFEEYSFATPLKKIGEIFGFSQKQLYGTQQDKLEKHSYWGISARVFLQKVGTELFRCELTRVLPEMKLGTNTIWCEIFKMKYNNGEFKKNVVIPDVRFLDEANVIHELGGVIIRLDRETKENNSHNGTVSTHASEQEMEKILADFVIDNNGNREKTFEETERIFKKLVE